MRLDTPVEQYKLGKTSIWVKRDDLMGDNVVLPPWGKLAGVRKVVNTLDKNVPIIHLNVFGSWSGWALSALAKELDMEFHMAFPKSRKITDDYLDIVLANGGQLEPLRHNMFRVLYAQVGKLREQKCWQMLPYAFNVSVYLNHMAKRLLAALDSVEGRIDNLIVSSGSGVTCAALVKAFFSYNPQGKFYTICVSSKQTVEQELLKKGLLTDSVHVELSPFKFDDVMPKHFVPFPCNQFWDKKAWYWTEQHASSLKGQTLFWNLGGEYTFLAR